MDETSLIVICSMCSAFSCMALVGGLFVFKKEVCNKIPKFPILCSTTTSSGTGGGGGAGDGGTTAPPGGTGTGSTSGTSVANGTEKSNVKMTTFGGTKADDNGEGFMGFDLFKMVGKINFNGKPVFPVAIYQGQVMPYLYKILEVKPKGYTTFYGIVADVCDFKKCGNKPGSKANPSDFLLDIHSTAWPTVGLKNGANWSGSGSFKVVGEVKPKDLDKSVWLDNGKSIVCSCTGNCTNKESKWTSVDQCTR